jgi:tol-pal system protein YbgF
MRGALPAAVGLLGLVVASTGCATNNGAIEEELSRLRREVRSLNEKISNNDLKLERLEGRVTLLALGQSGEVAPAPKTPVVGASEPKAVKPPPAERPKQKVEPKINQLTGPQRTLPVVKLSNAGEEDGSYDQGAIDDGSPPIVIKLQGDDSAGDDLPIDHGVLAKPDPVLHAPKKPKAEPVKAPPAKRQEPAAQREPEPEAEPAPEPAKKATKAEVKAAYEIALAKLRIDDDPATARTLFARFAKRYPSSEFADNVAYWSAECDFAERRFEDAAKSFHSMVEAFPRSPKVPDAMVREAEARTAMGQTERARGLLKKVIAQWSDSEAAKKAGSLLQGGEGRR